MKYRIHFEHVNGDKDHFDVEASTMREIRQAAHAGVEKRLGRNPWSEEIPWNGKL